MKKQNGAAATMTTSDELQSQIVRLEGIVARLRVEWDAETLSCSVEIDDAERYRRSINRCSELQAEIDRHERLIVRTKGELELALTHEAELVAEDRRSRVRFWAGGAKSIYDKLDDAATAFAKAVAAVEDHQNAGRQLGLRIIGELPILVPAALKAAQPKYLKVDSPVAAARATASFDAYSDPEDPKPSKHVPAPPAIHKIWDSPPSQWEAHMRNNALREQERNKRASNVPTWVGK